MSSVNKVLLIGHLGKDPKLTALPSGGKVASFSIATSERWKDKNSGEQREITHWHNIVVFNENLIGVVERFLKKGSRVYVEGALQTRKYTDNSGADRYVTEVVLKAYRGELVLLDSASREPPTEDAYGSTRAVGDPKPAERPPLDDDIPF